MTPSGGTPGRRSGRACDATAQPARLSPVTAAGRGGGAAGGRRDGSAARPERRRERVRRPPVRHAHAEPSPGRVREGVLGEAAPHTAAPALGGCRGEEQFDRAARRGQGDLVVGHGPHDAEAPHPLRPFDEPVRHGGVLQQLQVARPQALVEGRLDEGEDRRARVRVGDQAEQRLQRGEVRRPGGPHVVVEAGRPRRRQVRHRVDLLVGEALRQPDRQVVRGRDGVVVQPPLAEPWTRQVRVQAAQDVPLVCRVVPGPRPHMASAHVVAGHGEEVSGECAVRRLRDRSARAPLPVVPQEGRAGRRFGETGVERRFPCQVAAVAGGEEAGRGTDIGRLERSGRRRFHQGCPPAGVSPCGPRSDSAASRPRRARAVP